MSVLADQLDRRLLARSGAALVLVHARYWSTIAPRVRAQLERYEQRAQAIADPVLRSLALQKLSEQRFHAQGAATFATLAPSTRREHAVEAIVALEVIFDYLDGLTEQQVSDPLAAGHCLSRALIDAISVDREPVGGYYALSPQTDDCGYLDGLVAESRAAFALLPSRGAVSEVAKRCTARFTEAQVRGNAIASLGSAQLEEWATAQARSTTLGWLDYFAGATSSVLALHALIAAAADPRTTPQDAAQIDAVYLYIGVVITMLDGLIDYEHDMRMTGEPGYIRYYEDLDQLARALTNAARNAVIHARSAPNSAHHIMTLVSATAFYTSAPSSSSQIARPIIANLHRELRPLITPTLAIMRAWRGAKQLRATAAVLR